MKYTFQCLDSKYDEAEEMIVVLAFCEDFGEQRILHFPKTDFHWKVPGFEVPVEEMRKTAQLFKNKKFIMDIQDDPDRKAVEEEEGSDKTYKEIITSQMEKISEDMSNETRRTVQRLADVVERDRERRDKHPPTEQDILDEIAMRARFKDLRFQE